MAKNQELPRDPNCVYIEEPNSTSQKIIHVLLFPPRVICALLAVVLTILSVGSFFIGMASWGLLQRLFRKLAPTQKLPRWLFNPTHTQAYRLGRSLYLNIGICILWLVSQAFPENIPKK